jgi:integrase
MPKQTRFKTKYAGVTYSEGRRADGQVERIYYIRYRRDGKLIEEKAGRQYQDDMTPARAAGIRARKIEGDELSNREQREQEIEKQKAEESKWTVDRLWNQYKTDNSTIKGLRIDEYRYKKFILPAFREKEPQDLIPLDVDRVRVKMQKTQKPKTVSNVLELLRRIIKYGERKLLIPRLAFTIELPQVFNEKTEDLLSGELAELLHAIDENSHLPGAQMMSLALFTGMRRGELFKLQWRDIDFERGFISLRDPKGGPDQKIPLNESARGIFDSIGQGTGFVFPGRAGAQRTSIRTQINRIKKEARLPKDFRPLQGLRHVYASMLASSGQVDLYTLQKLLTHKSPQMTQRYAHLRDEALRNASDLAGDIIGAIRAKNGEPVVQLLKKGDK